MAPPRVIQKSALPNTMQRTIRQSHRPSQQNVTKYRENSDAFDEDEATYVDDEAMDEEPDESQSTSVETLISNMINDVGTASYKL
jgi:hypothetical protein